MLLPTWDELRKDYCSNLGQSPYYEDFSRRRYNPSSRLDNDVCRLVFLRGVLTDPRNKTLRRNGRFIWCKNFAYEGVGRDGFRTLSFTIDKGQKRFKVSEHNILCVPLKTYVHNHKFFRPHAKTFLPFAAPFEHPPILNLLKESAPLLSEQLELQIVKDNPYRPGTLVSARRGYFYPEVDGGIDSLGHDVGLQHPCGIVLGPSFSKDNYFGRHFYRVRFGKTTYEKVHPVQMEIINEV